jgi:hypothetical protein
MVWCCIQKYCIIDTVFIRLPWYLPYPAAALTTLFSRRPRYDGWVLGA